VYGHKLRAYDEAAETVGVAISTMRAWVREYEMMEYVVLQSKRGKHAKTPSPILDDFEFREEFKAHVKNSSREQGKYTLHKIESPLKTQIFRQEKPYLSCPCPVG
jgi:transposase